MQNTSANTQDNQKLVIGPWTHGTIAEDIVGDDYLFLIVYLILKLLIQQII